MLRPVNRHCCFYLELSTDTQFTSNEMHPKSTTPHIISIAADDTASLRTEDSNLTGEVPVIQIFNTALPGSLCDTFDGPWKALMQSLDLTEGAGLAGMHETEVREIVRHRLCQYHDFDESLEVGKGIAAMLMEVFKRLCWDTVHKFCCGVGIIAIGRYMLAFWD